MFLIQETFLMCSLDSIKPVLHILNLGWMLSFKAALEFKYDSDIKRPVALVF